MADHATYSKYFRDLLYHAIILSKSGLGGPTVFDFKYVPQLGKSTGKEDLPSQEKDSMSKRRNRPAERFLLAAFLIGCGMMAVTVALGIKVGMLVWKHSQQVEI